MVHGLIFPEIVFRKFPSNIMLPNKLIDCLID